MRASAEIASSALCVVMANAESCDFESQLAALFEYECKKRNAEMAYVPVVAAQSSNACAIHYTRNNMPIEYI